jgi:hypothetical protein
MKPNYAILLAACVWVATASAAGLKSSDGEGPARDATSNAKPLSTETAISEFDPWDMGSLPSRVTFGVGANPSTWVGSTDMDLAMRNGFRLGLGISADWGTSFDGPVQTNSTLVSFGSDPMETWSASISYDRWGQSSVIQTETSRLQVGWAPGCWFFSVTPEHKSIAWFSQTPNSPTKRLFSSANGISGRVSSSCLERFNLSVSALKYTYNDLPRDFEPLAIIGFVSNSSLSAGSGLLDHARSFDVGYNLNDDWTTSLEWSFSRSQIDQQDLNVFVLRTDFYGVKDWSFSVSGGQAYPLGFSPSYLVDASASFTWK